MAMRTIRNSAPEAITFTSNKAASHAKKRERIGAFARGLAVWSITIEELLWRSGLHLPLD